MRRIATSIPEFGPGTPIVTGWRPLPSIAFARLTADEEPLDADFDLRDALRPCPRDGKLCRDVKPQTGAASA